MTVIGRNAKARLLGGQASQLYAVDERGKRVLDEDGNPIFDLDRAPLVLAAAGVQKRLTGATLAGSTFKPASEVREWYAELLAGDGEQYLAVLIGDGANYTSAALLRNAVERGLVIAWYDWGTFVDRYTERITRDRLLSRGSAEDAMDMSMEVISSSDEDDNLNNVYDVLAIIDFDINAVRDFAVPEICAMFRRRSGNALTTLIAVPMAESEAMDTDASVFGARGSLIRLFEHEAKVFDARQ